MTAGASLLLAALAVTPSDRLAMADRLFNRGKAAEARVEYEALAGEKSIAPDELLFRMAECDRLTGANASAQDRYAELAMKYPESRHAGQARFLCAMGATGETRLKMLAALDTDRIDVSIRTAALYHLGVEANDLSALEKCVRLEPKGKYADYANLRRGATLVKSPLAAERRKGLELLVGIAFSTSTLSEEALYLAAIQSYREKKYSEAGSLFRRYLKRFADKEHAADARVMGVWCDFMEGRYADAAAACGEGTIDDLAYIRAACAYSTGETVKALALFRKYLEDFPNGKYRADAELPIARIEFDAANAGGDGAKTIESAKRGFGLSKLAADELRLAWAYEKVGKTQEAQDEYARIVQNFPKSEEAAEALFRRAMIEVRANNWPAAELALAESLATGKGLKFKPQACYWRGVAAMQLGHDEEGARFLKEALDIGLTLDESREARLLLADFDLRSGRREASIKAYEQLVREGACARMSATRLLSVGKLVGGATGRTCAQALMKMDSPEWRQAGWALLGDVELASSSFTAAIAAYRKSLAEPAKTEEAARVALALGRLETRAGEYEAADATLKKSVAFNADNARIRAEAYVALAKNAEAKGDFKTACAYATVVTSLFDDVALCEAAKKILAAHPEAAE